MASQKDDKDSQPVFQQLALKLIDLLEAEVGEAAGGTQTVVRALAHVVAAIGHEYVIQVPNTNPMDFVLSITIEIMDIMHLMAQQEAEDGNEDNIKQQLH